LRNGLRARFSKNAENKILMKKQTRLVLSLVFIMSFGFIYAFAARINKAVDELTPQERAELAFYVYADAKAIRNHYTPSGYMGDGNDLSLLDKYSSGVYAGKTAIRVKYTPRGNNKWAGVYWQSPSNNWGDKDGGLDLSKATYITFWMRGETGQEVIDEVKIGGLKGTYVDSCVASKKKIKLTKDWKMYYIDLRKKDTSYIMGGFSFIVSKTANMNGCVFYIDEIRYEMNK